MDDLSFLTKYKLHEICFLGIDVQKFFCDVDFRKKSGLDNAFFPNDDTDKVAKKIASIAPQFNALSIPVAWIFLDNPVIDGKKYDISPLHHIVPDENDAIFPKTLFSPFVDNVSEYADDFMEYLKEMGVKVLIISGVNTSSCIYHTVKHSAILGYETVVLTDAIADGSTVQERQRTQKASLGLVRYMMQDQKKDVVERIHYSKSSDVLDCLRR